MKRKTIFYTKILFICFLAGFLFIQCNQEPLFWAIANEYAPTESLISGAPSKIVGGVSPNIDNLYICNWKNIYEYDYAEELWKALPVQPPGAKRDLAVADSKLFALSQDNKIRMYDGTNWDTKITVPDGTTIEKIFGVDTWLFAGVKSSTGDYSVLSLSVPAGVPSSTWTELTGPNALLMGVARKGLNDYYLGTLGDGLYSSNGSAASVVASFVDTDDDKIIIGLAMHNSKLYTVHPKKIRNLAGDKIAEDNFSGAIAVWSHGGKDLLLVGLWRASDSVNNYGYREIAFDGGGDPTPLLVPGREDTTYATSVKVGAQHIKAIGDHPVNHLYVLNGVDADDGESSPYVALPPRPVILASTSDDGLWSYRKRGGIPQWNGEDNK